MVFHFPQSFDGIDAITDLCFYKGVFLNILEIKWFYSVGDGIYDVPREQQAASIARPFLFLGAVFPKASPQGEGFFVYGTSRAPVPMFSLPPSRIRVPPPSSEGGKGCCTGEAGNIKGFPDGKPF